ncbi:aldose 1-epimerase [Cellulomonas citrea]|uniref:aldose 1-epimerase n=1 Tax=Cellulomonas citrea TaxID=1909423 RepID=UPI001358501F|nr:aldose epimerase [Cellulomonas citrea]
MTLDLPVLTSSTWQVGVLPATGGTLAFGRVATEDGLVDVLRPTPAAALRRAERTASYPLIPWSNRIGEGLLRFGGRTWQLRRNADDGTASHGTVLDYPWDVVTRRDDLVELALTSADLVGVNFPWRFAAGIGYRVDGPDLLVHTWLTNEDDEPFPAGFGHHPFFQRHLRPADGGARLQVPAEACYDLVGAIATGPAVPVTERLDFRTARTVGDRPVDDCLTGFGPQGARAVIAYDDLELALTGDPVYSHLVVYVPRGRAYFAVEPVTHVNGAHALLEAGVPGAGLAVLEPGRRLTGGFRLRVAAPTGPGSSR